MLPQDVGSFVLVRHQAVELGVSCHRRYNQGRDPIFLFQALPERLPDRCMERREPVAERAGDGFDPAVVGRIEEGGDAVPQVDAAEVIGSLRK
jgi:hypothetical protein